MALKRSMIRLTPEERAKFLATGRTLYLASNGDDGYPHLIAMWYALEPDGAIAMTTYRKSQKVKNVERDPRCAILLEEGATYDKLKGVFLRGRCEIIDDEERTLATLGKVGARMAGSTAPLPPEALGPMRSQAKKRVTLLFRADKTRSWDHSKLAGAY
ncbi:MAG TPA: pyridoxamine 5'-phosphate oxidase family protein [Candidatus Binatia bacterium]|nr:pyridoxamine 5'-phosphate oxidase family protein [Candidatus Binatia bacterium]